MPAIPPCLGLGPRIRHGEQSRENGTDARWNGAVPHARPCRQSAAPHSSPLSSRSCRRPRNLNQVRSSGHLGLLKRHAGAVNATVKEMRYLHLFNPWPNWRHQVYPCRRVLAPQKGKGRFYPAPTLLHPGRLSPRAGARQCRRSPRLSAALRIDAAQVAPGVRDSSVRHRAERHERRSTMSRSRAQRRCES
jgi:hypothetical protein